VPEWPALTPRDEMLSRVIHRGQHLRRLRLLAIGAATTVIAAGGVLGYRLGTSGAVDVLGEGTIDAGGVAVEYHDCPGTGPSGRFHRGDRVLITGRDEAGTWVEVRSPVDALDRVWIPAAVVTPDADLEVPVVDDCTLDDGTTLELAGGEIVTTTTTDTTLPDEESTTTTEGPTPSAPPATSPPPAPGPSTPTPTAPPVTPPPAPAVDTSPPSIGSITRQLAEIWEDHHVGDACAASSPLSTWVRAQISDPRSGVASASLSWTVRDNGGNVVRQGSMPMVRIAGTSSSGTWEATIGPLTGDTLPGSSYYPGQISIQIVATNGDGVASGPAIRTSFITLRDCTFG